MDKWIRRERFGALRRMAPGHIAFVFAGLVSAAIWALAIWKVADDTREIHASAQTELLGAQNLLAAQFARVTDSAFVTIGAADTWMFDHRGEPADLSALKSFVEDVLHRQSFSMRLNFFNAAAERIQLPGAAEGAFSIADREYIATLDDNDFERFKIGLQARSRLIDADIIPVAKLARENAFGIKFIVAAIDVPELNRLFDKLFVSAPGYVGAFRDDGHLIYRHPDPDRYVGIKLDLDYFMGPQVMRDSRGLILDRKDPDGRPLTIAYNKVEKHPLYVYASFRNRDLDARSVARRPFYFGGATLISLLGFGLAALIAYFARIREREAAALRAALITANAANIVKRDFLANVSHELRTPLNAIIGFSEMIGTGIFGNLSAKNAEYNADVVTAARHLLTIVDQLLDIAAIESGRARLTPEELQLTPFMRDIVHMVSNKAAARCVKIDIVAPEPHRAIVCDKRVLRQIVLNILDNAVKFSRDGGRVRIGWRATAGKICLFVADEGMGMSPDDLSHIFEPFWRSSDAYIARPDGVGLGMMVTKQLVGQIGGTIAVESALGKGTEFTIEIPDTPVPAAAFPSRAA